MMPVYGSISGSLLLAFFTIKGWAFVRSVI